MQNDHECLLLETTKKRKHTDVKKAKLLAPVAKVVDLVAAEALGGVQVGKDVADNCGAKMTSMKGLGNVGGAKLNHCEAIGTKPSSTVRLPLFLDGCKHSWDVNTLHNHRESEVTPSLLDGEDDHRGLEIDALNNTTVN